MMDDWKKQIQGGISSRRYRCPRCGTVNEYTHDASRFRCGRCNGLFGKWEAIPEVETGRPIGEPRRSEAGS